VNARTQTELQQAVIAMKKYHRQMELTLAPLENDLNFALSHLVSDKRNQQFWRRTIIRCILAYTEALIWNTKHGIPIITTISWVQIPSNELEIIREEKTVTINGKTEIKPNFLKFRDNLKATFKLFAKAHGADFKINCDQNFDALCETYELRSRLMHPKKPFDPDVSDTAIVASQRGVKWLSDEFCRLMTECQEAIPKITKAK
jgi:hypothetical protein